MVTRLPKRLQLLNHPGAITATPVNLS
jgi:hypothetical protein